MASGPSPEPNASAPRPGAAAPGPDGAYSAPVPPQVPMPPHLYPQQPWTGPGQPGGPPPPDRPKGLGLAAVAVIIGLAACVVPLLPFDVLAERRYVGFPPALGGLVLAIGACTGGRRGKPLAVVGVVLCALGVLLGLWMLAMGI